jgi:hypothetical protein
VIAYVMPTNRGPLTQIAERGPVSRPVSVRAAAGAPPSEHTIDSPITELLAAINAEQERADRRAQPVRPSTPPVPHRTVQQLPEQLRPAPQRQQRVERRQVNRVATADSRMAGVYARADRR